LNRMLPGMIGAVNYGSGRKAYRPEQTVAGKTGTCIGQGAWLGLFTSYAPVVDPKLAVVVITRGTDAHNHLPAAVAGDIYRALSPRFGTQINFEVAKTADDDDETAGKDKKAVALDEEAQETKAETQKEEKAIEEKAEKEAADATAKDLEKTSLPLTAAPAANSKVKATVMPIENKPKTQKTTTPAKPAANQPNEGRPRKINEP